MSTFSGYKTKAFSPSQKFFVLDPNTGSPSFVNGSDLVAQLTPNSKYVYSESTRTTAQATDYAIGSLVQTAGATLAGDNFASTYLVVASGAGDFPMDNGNELLVIKGDEFLREQLAQDVSTGNGANLVNGATIYAGSVAELEALSLEVGVNVSLTESVRSGEGVIKSGTHPADTQNGLYIDLANGNYWERSDNYLTVGMFGILADGSDEDAKFTAMCETLSGTGKTVHHLSGTIQIKTSTDIDGFTLWVHDQATIDVNGTSTTAFVTGGLNVDAGGVLKGSGEVFTSGTMTFAFDGASTVFIGPDGTLDGPTVYGHLYAALKSDSGNLKAGRAIGGSYRGIELNISVDKPYYPRVDYFNGGVPYINKIPDTVNVPTDSRAFHIRPSINVSSVVNVHTNSAHSLKNGLWCNTDDTETKFFENLTVTGVVEKAGFILDAAGNETTGIGAATCIEVLSAPDAVINAITRQALGYNVAVAANSHRAQVLGEHVGKGGDPVCVVVDSDDVVVDAHLSGGTVGLSVGEDGARADNCRMVGGSISKCAYGPILSNACKKLTITGVSLYEEPYVGNVTGSFLGPGQVQPAVRCLADTQDVIFKNNHLHGFFNMDVAEIGTRGRLRVSRSGNVYSAPIVPTASTYFKVPFVQQTDGADFIRILDDASTTGHTFVGETTILGASADQYAILDLSPVMTDLTAFIEAGETLDTVLRDYAVVVHVKYVNGIEGNEVRFGITDSFNAAQTGVGFASPFGVSSPGNNIAGKWHTPNVGDFYPVVMPLSDVLYDPADPANLLFFIIRKLDVTSYDLTVTNPVLVYVGKQKRAIT